MTNSASAVGLGARLSNAVFGSPCASRANGMRDASIVPPSFRRAAWFKRRASTPVFAVDRHGPRTAYGLPRVWVTEPAYDERNGRFFGREFVGSYPSGVDPYGAKALRLAQAYFAEALGYSRDQDCLVRRDCFRAAELLYLHAAARGCVEASLKLGVLYSADLCEGYYWGWKDERGDECRMGLLPREAQAFERFSFAAVRGSAEACWQLGSLVLEGRGCAADPAQAQALFVRAFDLARRCGDVESAGNAALRLGLIFENALCGSRNLKQALSWYRLSAEAFDEALEQGAWHYKKSRHQARMGFNRVKQELSGRY